MTTAPTERAPYGLLVEQGAALSTDAFRSGRFVVQDEAAQLVALLGSIAPGASVLDLCAAPGGKTLVLAARAGAQGRVVACDVRPRRVRLLQSTLARCRASDVDVVQVSSSGDLPFQSAVFDFVLVDAPCSGLGTLRRDPDIRWRRSEADLVPFAAAQLELLGRAADLVRPGGTLVYATCSSEPEENEAVARAFLSDRPGFSPQLEHVTLPFRDRLEAFYAAVITRNV